MKDLLKIKSLLLEGRLNFFLFLLVVFTLPISRQLFTYALWPWILSWIIEGKYHEKFNKQHIKDNIFAILFLPGLFFLMLFAIFWSGDKPNGLNQIGIQASLVIFPFFLTFSNKIYRNNHSFRKVVLSFCSGIAVVSLFLLLKAFLYAVSFNHGQLNFHPIINQWENVFFFSQYSYLIHPTYLGLMVLLAILFCVVDLKEQFVIYDRKLTKVMLIIYFGLIVFLLSARSIILATILLSLFLYLKLISHRILKLVTILILLTGLVLFLGLNPRANRLINVLKHNGEESLENVDARIKIWKATTILLKEKPILGVGTGDVKNQLETIYEKNNYGFTSNFNCHNQFLEQWLGSGLISLLLLLAAMVFPLFSAKYALPRIYYSGFLLITGFVFLFESVLCRFWGVAFFSIFYTLLTKRRTEVADKTISG